MALLLTRRYLVALVGATVLVGLATGIPTDVLPNPWFTRMTPVRTLDLVLWPLTSIAVGSVFATLVLDRPDGSYPGVTAGTGGGLLSVFAISCPICTKVVVLVLGASGALTYFAPIQPVLGVAALALAGIALRYRMRQLSARCPLPRSASRVAPRSAEG